MEPFDEEIVEGRVSRRRKVIPGIGDFVYDLLESGPRLQAALLAPLQECRIPVFFLAFCIVSCWPGSFIGQRFSRRMLQIIAINFVADAETEQDAGNSLLHLCIRGEGKKLLFICNGIRISVQEILEGVLILSGIRFAHLFFTALGRSSALWLLSPG